MSFLKKGADEIKDEDEEDEDEDEEDEDEDEEDEDEDEDEEEEKEKESKMVEEAGISEEEDSVSSSPSKFTTPTSSTRSSIPGAPKKAPMSDSSADLKKWSQLSEPETFKIFEEVHKLVQSDAQGPLDVDGIIKSDAAMEKYFKRVLSDFSVSRVGAKSAKIRAFRVWKNPPAPEAAPKTSGGKRKSSLSSPLGASASVSGEGAGGGQIKKKRPSSIDITPLFTEISNSSDPAVLGSYSLFLLEHCLRFIQLTFFLLLNTP